MAALVIAEHDNQGIKPATLNTVTTALACSAEVHVLVAGHGAAQAAQSAAAIAGVAKVLHADDAGLAHGLAENVAAQVLSIAAGYSPMINRVMRMSMKDRMRLAMKGDREARNILIRDPNRIVAQAVVQNPKITEQEIEKIATMRTVPEEVLRLIAINRKWARNYPIMVKLAQNPRTPLSNSISILTRLQTKDLLAMAKNRNIFDAIRKQSQRLASARVGR